MTGLQIEERYTRERLETSLRTNFYLFVRKVFDELHSGSVKQFLDCWHVEAMCYQFQRLFDGEITRLLVSVPPRHLKSIIAAVAYPAWVLGHDPTRLIMVATYSAELAELHSRHFRKIVTSKWYRNLFPSFKIDPVVNRALELGTIEGGSRKAVSVQGGHTGFGATDIIMDDLMKATEARSETIRMTVKEFYGSLTTRIDDKKIGRIASIQQRLHEDDLPAHLLELGTYRHLELKAIADKDESHDLYEGRIANRRADEVLFPEREPHDVLKG